MKPGVKTTEFYFNLLVLIGTFVLVFLGKLESDVWLIVSGLQGVGYAASRAYTKAKSPIELSD